MWKSSIIIQINGCSSPKVIITSSKDTFGVPWKLCYCSFEIYRMSFWQFSDSFGVFFTFNNSSWETNSGKRDLAGMFRYSFLFSSILASLNIFWIVFAKYLFWLNWIITFSDSNFDGSFVIFFSKSKNTQNVCQNSWKNFSNHIECAIFEKIWRCLQILH